MAIVWPTSLAWEQVVVASRDPVALGHWWSEALRWVIVNDDPVEFEIQQRADWFPGILFLAVDDAKRGPNRVHIDLRPDDQRAEVDRLIGLGASRVDVGQGDSPWVVLADPEGDEFCVLGRNDRRPRRSRRGTEQPLTAASDVRR